MILFICHNKSLLKTISCITFTIFIYSRFVILNAGVIYVYVSNFQNIDEEEYGGMWEITKEGFMTSFAGFLVRNFK